MTEVFIAIGLVFVIEGLLYALFPKAMKNIIEVVLAQSENSIRTTGLCAVFIGVVIIYFIK
jgi:uncharacterized protein YjeT (DUF2065 family)